MRRKERERRERTRVKVKKGRGREMRVGKLFTRVYSHLVFIQSYFTSAKANSVAEEIKMHGGHAISVPGRMRR